MKNIIEKASYVFEFAYDDRYDVVKDRFGDFDGQSFVDHKTVEEYFGSGYEVAVLDYNGRVDKVNF